MAPESSSDHLSIVYDGSRARHGEMYFYEFSRAAYGASRLVTTIEVFRRSGRVAQRISRKNYVPLIIKAPERGSFPLDIIIPVAVQTAQAIKEYDIPVGDFIKYIIHLLKRTLPKDESTIIELAKLELKREQQKTAQSRQETARLEEVRRIVESGNAGTAAAIDVLKKSIASGDRRIEATHSEMTRILQDLREQQKRQTGIEEYSEQLEAIGEEKLLQLVNKARPQLEQFPRRLTREG